MSTHNLCFGAKIRKIGIPLHTQVLLYKSGVRGGIHYMDMCRGGIHYTDMCRGGIHYTDMFS